MVDFATAASQNGFSTSKLSLQDKTNIIQKIFDSFITFIFSHRAIVKQDNNMTHLVSYANTVL